MVMAPYCSEPIWYETFSVKIYQTFYGRTHRIATHPKNWPILIWHTEFLQQQNPQKGLAEECIQAENYTKQRRQSFRFKVPHLTDKKEEHTVFE